MINFSVLEKRLPTDHKAFLLASPIEHIVIDNFCELAPLERALNSIPDPEVVGANKSRDYIFAKNKFEKSDFDLKYRDGPDYGEKETSAINLTNFVTEINTVGYQPNSKGSVE